MPNIEPVVAAQDRVRLRLVGPQAAVWPDSPGAVPLFAVLQSTTMIARPLPVADVPGSPDFVSGTYDLRLDDAGDVNFLWPNSTSSDGIPWKSRFDVTGHLCWLEVYFDGELDSVCVIDQNTPDEAQVTVHGDDGWWLLKKAYVRDWIVTQAPRDVIERGTQLWVPAIADNFPTGALNPQWTPIVGTGGTVEILPTGGCLLFVAGSSGGGSAQITSSTSTVAATGVWTANYDLSYLNFTGNNSVTAVIIESGSQSASIQLSYNTSMTANFEINATTVAASMVPSATTYSASLESDGTWIYAFVNGQLIGCGRRPQPTTTSLQTYINVNNAPDPTSPIEIVASGVLVDALQPFLQRGADKGDYVLPGDQTTYPTGGLQARYFNDTDLAGLATAGQYLTTVLNPTRTQSYGTSTPAEYQDQQDATIDGQAPPAGSSTAGNYWSAIWFGAIYLPLSKGNITMEIVLPSTAGGEACRVWVGKTQFGSQVFDEWTLTDGIFTFVVAGANLAGTLPYGAGTVIRDGWYPIKIEYAMGASTAGAPQLYFNHIPTPYTDPGGTSITTAGGVMVIPATSLSPLGMMDQRYQGIAHFDLVQQTLQAVGYHTSVEPHQLESGLFPGVLAPRVREGHDTDIVLQADRGPRQDGEGILNYSSTLDSTDFASSLQGNGAGIQSGASGQLQGLIFDAATMTGSLFDAQQWQDFSDAQQPSLLNGLLNAQLNLQLEPWQSLSADPTGRPRKTFTWPLPGAIANMRWRPGDGIMIREPQINVYDTSPRQMMVVTRNFGPFGIQSTQATFANRPRNPAKALKQQFFTATRLQRNYQRQRVAINSAYVLSNGIAAGATDSNLAIVALSPGDQIVDATLRITSATGQVGVSVNSSTDISAGIGGPWTNMPVEVGIGAFAVPTVNNQLYVQLVNKTGGSINVQYQLICDVLR